MWVGLIRFNRQVEAHSGQHFGPAALFAQSPLRPIP
jgi:hypothetical protein